MAGLFVVFLQFECETFISRIDFYGVTSICLVTGLSPLYPSISKCGGLTENTACVVCFKG